jgi:hypothetical protein
MTDIERGVDNDISLPLILNSVVIKGFGRGSKELGIPTGKHEVYCNRNLLYYF